ncbi:MAG: hypothetical protein KatS3mg043_1238 [Rhodothermaceae bacterium]|nr:MAG: hypothetical protein KatS3mg043_1238 [Rhodothermaceae bacterium]
MDWVWSLYKPYILRELARIGNQAPTEEELQEAFLEALSDSTVTVLVQEPWQNAVRFRGLARYAAGSDRDAAELFDLLRDPETFLQERFGGGKFKLNFHRGWHFVATRNFKPEGPPRWKDLPEIEF